MRKTSHQRRQRNRQDASRIPGRYFRELDGEPPHGIYDMVITNVERALIDSVMTRADGNQTQPPTCSGMNRNTLRTKIEKYGIR